MQRTILKVSRVIFVGIFSLFCLGFLFWEAYSLTSGSGENQVLGIFSINQDDQNSSAVIGLPSADLSEGEVSVEIKSNDARRALIKKYLEKYKSPLVRILI